MTFIGNGMVRDVSSVEYHGKMVVVKTLRASDDRRRQMVALDKHNREVLALDAVSAERVTTACILSVPNRKTGEVVGV